MFSWRMQTYLPDDDIRTVLSNIIQRYFRRRVPDMLHPLNLNLHRVTKKHSYW